MYLSGGSVGPGPWLLELSPELLVFWAEACCPSCPLWGAPPWAWALMLPNGGKEAGLEEAIPLAGWPADVIRLLEAVEPLTGPLVLLLGTEEPPMFPGPCWLEVELGVCVDDDWFGEGKGWVKRELSNGCDARYGAEERAHGMFHSQHETLNGIFTASLSAWPSFIFFSCLYSASWRSPACLIWRKSSGVKGGNGAWIDSLSYVLSKRKSREMIDVKTQNQSSHFKPTKVVSAHLCIEFEPCEGIAVGASSLEEPITDWLIHQGLSIAATNQD